MKRLLAILLIFALLILPAGCGDTTSEPSATQDLSVTVPVVESAGVTETPDVQAPPETVYLDELAAASGSHFSRNTRIDDFYLFIYNSEHLSDDDAAAILDYFDRSFSGDNIHLLDAAGFENAFEVYDAIKDIAVAHDGIFSGVQIFGYAEAVPSFEAIYLMMYTNTTKPEGGEQETFVTDYFYGNLNNSEAVLADYSIYADFAEERGVDYSQDWPIARLLLDEGEYGAYFQKYRDYLALTNDVPRHLNVFSASIFPVLHLDAADELIVRLDEKYGILSREDYTLYGTAGGIFPAVTDTVGDFTKETLQEANEAGIADFFINSHGSSVILAKTLFYNSSDIGRVEMEGEYIQTRKLNDENMEEFEVWERLAEIINFKEWNGYMDANYYNIVMKSCATAYDMGAITFSAVMLKGKAINVIAATYNTSNRGITEPLEEGNPHYLYYRYFDYLYGGMGRSESFWRATQDFMEMALTGSRDMDGDLNYQMLINNALVMHYFGLLK